ncbi:tail fiber domain-containing protein [Peredibacter starrii]|uniref:Tail fiber domain-containing protein n=1 Tax=Peredibacter starrii TaxID=28202 RepID=A0AAX4HRQ0_9BACT|nr:tail fiber domain-containing protein [Peredibacter starrii]WPU66040.1 tail fiber domain-containing protein [Peredibacter starrii]
MRSKLTSKFLVITAITFISYAYADSLSYSGRLVNANGSPVVGPVNLKFDLSSTADTSTVLCSQQISSVALTNGVFHVKLDLNCGASTLSQVLGSIVSPDSAAIRVTNETASKTYSFQSLHSVPSAQIAHGLSKLNANNNEVLTWTGSKWEPKPVTGATGGTVTDITAGTGLSGGTITNSGTIAIANGGVTDTHLAGNISRSKLAAGTANSVVITNGAGVMTEVGQLPVSNGGTGSSTAAGARTNLGLGSASVANLGYASGNALPADNIPVCLPAFKLHFTGVGPTYWSCEADNDTNLDATKLPLAGGTMTGSIDMGTKSIINLANPVDPADAVNKAYVDAQVGGSSSWTKSGSDIYNNNSGMVGVGLSSFYPDMKFQIETRPINANGRAINADLRQHTTTNGTYGLLGGVFKGQTTIASGVTNAGNLTGTWSVAFRNNLPGTLDNGTLAGIKGDYIQYGHYNSEAASTPLTTDVYGLYLSPHYKTGTISNLYDIYVHSGSGGGSVSNYYGLYLPGSAKKNYFEGNLGINVSSPTEKLDVDGNIAATGKLRLKSTTANYVELKAPDALASTLTFNLPGTNGTSGQALITDGSGNLSWSTISASGTSVGGDLTGTVSNAQIAAGAIVDADISASAAIAQTKISGLAASFTAKQDFITAGTTAQYWRGDKSWQTLNTTAVAEGTNLYFLDSRVRAALMATYATGSALPVSTSDTLLQALGKLEGQIVANKAAFDGSGVWSKNSTNVYYNGGNVGIGTNTPVQALDVRGSISALGRIYDDTGASLELGISGKATSINDGELQISSSGYVGVGTTNPQARLDVDGSLQLGRAVDNSTSRYLNIQTGTDTNNAGNGFANGDSVIRLDGGANSGTNTLHLFGNGSRVLNLDLFDGSLFVANKLGIGTAAPSGRLTVSSQGNTLTDYTARFQSSGTVAGAGGILFDQNSAYSFKLHTEGTSATSGRMVFSYINPTDGTVTNDNILTLGRGFVGIGTNVPVTLLSNIPNTDSWSNVGDVNGTGQNTQSFSWKTSAAGYSAAIINTNSGVTGNGLQVRTTGTSSGHNIFTAGTGVASGANTDIFSVRGNGTVGINMITPQAALDVNGYSASPGVGTMRIRNSYNSGGSRYWQIGPDGNGSGNFVVYTDGLAGAYIVYGQTAWSSSSDRRLKKEIEPIEDSLSKIMQLNGVTYKYKKDKESDPRKAGVIAQELKKVLPEAVTEADGYLSVKYTEIIPLLIEGIKDLFKENKREIASVKAETDARIKKLEAENAALKKQNAEMNARLDRIEKSLNRP